MLRRISGYVAVTWIGGLIIEFFLTPRVTLGTVLSVGAICIVAFVANDLIVHRQPKTRDDGAAVDEMLPEYDLKHLRPNPYAQQLQGKPIIRRRENVDIVLDVEPNDETKGN